LTIACRVVGEAIAGGQAGWINLRHDALGLSNPWAPLRKWVRVAVVLGILLPAVLAATFCWRGLRYEAMAGSACQEQSAAYRRMFPNQPVPRPLNARLRSDLARLTAVSGGAGQIPPRVNALETLRQLVAALDPSMRVHIQELRLGPGDVFLEGQSRDHSNAEAVARALSARGFAMEQPNSEVLPNGGVSFTLAGQPPGREDLAQQSEEPAEPGQPEAGPAAPDVQTRAETNPPQAQSASPAGSDAASQDTEPAPENDAEAPL
jgi:hypothetical protein